MGRGAVQCSVLRHGTASCPLVKTPAIHEPNLHLGLPAVKWRGNSAPLQAQEACQKGSFTITLPIGSAAAPPHPILLCAGHRGRQALTGGSPAHSSKRQATQGVHCPLEVGI